MIFLKEKCYLVFRISNNSVWVYSAKDKTVVVIFWALKVLPKHCHCKHLITNKYYC